MKKAKIRKAKKVEKSLLLSDFHFDEADDALVELVAFKFGKKFKPDNIFLNGDVIDFTSLSKYPQHASSTRSALGDIKATKRFLTRLRRTFPKTRIVFVLGNHGVRMDKYLSDFAPELYPFMSLEEILELDKLKIEYKFSIHKENTFEFHDMLIGHFNKFAAKPGYTASALIDKCGISLIQGHVHKAAIIHKTLHGGRILTGIENPCLAKDPPSYAPSTNWQQGFTTLETLDGVTFPQVTVIRPIGNRRGFVFNGDVFLTDLV